MTELYEFVKNYDEGWSYAPEEALYAAREQGLIKEVEWIGSTVLNDRRWGVTELQVFEIDGGLVGIQVYVMHNDDGEDLFEDMYPVESYQVTVTKYRRTNVNG